MVRIPLKSICRHLDVPENQVRVVPVGGGCIHQAARLTAPGGSWFVKFGGSRGTGWLFAGERKGLEALLRAVPSGLRVPRVVAAGEGEGVAYLILEWIALQPDGDWERLGRELARLHENHEAGDRYGFESDNAIGRTPQRNRFEGGSWADFWVTCRIEPIFRHLHDAGSSEPDTEGLLKAIANLLRGHAPAAAPLHGDLWAGNVGFDDGGRPVIFDPAFYRGDPETDLAFSRFFGGFPRSFYRAYVERVPPRPGADIREAIYNLYHALNHLLLFGETYRSSVEGLRRRIETAV